jgi:sensor c-di-GMP phosphodiesterase-like protein
VLKILVDDLSDLLKPGDFRVTMNIATQDLHDPLFVTFIEQCLQSRGLPSTSVGLELTERSTADEATAINAIRRLESRGHTVYIDDFGTGYSSLAYLHRLAVHAIKIDPSFTRTVGTDAVTASVIPQILEMARELDLLVVVEGIETEKQLEYFSGHSSVRLLGQGFYFGQAITASELREALAKQQTTTRQPLIPFPSRDVE